MSFSTLVVSRWRRWRGHVPSRSAAEAQVTKAYRMVLQREPDAAGLSAYAEQLATGRRTPQDLFEELTASDEFTAKHREQIERLYKALLRRDADASGLEHHLARIERGDASLIDLVDGIASSEEFAVRAVANERVARHIARDVIVGITDRDPGPDAIKPYADALSAGRPLLEFVQEMKQSPESRISGNGPVTGSIGIAVLTQELIAAHLTAEGSTVMLPPMPALGSDVVTTAQIASLVRTLAMLGQAEPGRTGGDGSSTVSRSRTSESDTGVLP